MIAMYTRAKKLPKYEKINRGKKEPRDGMLLKKELETIAMKEKRR
jgi:hypothetical protein